MSYLAARYQQEIDAIDADLWLLHDAGAGEALVAPLEAARQEAFELMWEAFEENARLSRRPSLEMRATSAAEYEQAVAASLLPPMTAKVRVIDYKKIKEDNPLRDYVERFGPVIDRGRTVLAHCPGHEDRRPSLIVYVDTDSWWCPVCNRGGDIFHYEEMRLGRKALPGEG